MKCAMGLAAWIVGCRGALGMSLPARRVGCEWGDRVGKVDLLKVLWSVLKVMKAMRVRKVVKCWTGFFVFTLTATLVGAAEPSLEASASGRSSEPSAVIRDQLPGSEPNEALSGAPPEQLSAPLGHQGDSKANRMIQSEIGVDENLAIQGDSEGETAEKVEPEKDDADQVEVTSEKPEVEDHEESLAWRPPQYDQQKQALGYTGPETFAIPRGMEERVAFWLEIYTKYTTQEGLLHDSQYINNIYEKVSFVEIENDPTLSPGQKSKRKRDLIKNAKRRIRERLLSLEKVDNPSRLSGEDLRYFKMYESQRGRHKFREAAQNGRLRFQLGQKDRFIEGIFASGRYLPTIEQIFRERNLPLELTRLPFVESSFNIFAYSKVGASGIWQIMRYTARPYMRVGLEVDERNDPLKASRVAAKILETNYKMLGTWPLALTGYNHGPSGVGRLVKKLKTTEITKIIELGKSRRFGFASENFYACFLAALEAERNAEKYYGKVKTSRPLHAHEIVLEKRLDYKQLVEWFDGDTELTRLYNPHLLSSVRRGRSPIPRNTMVRVLTEKMPVVTAYLSQPRQEPIHRSGRYRVQSGDNLSSIARRHGVSLMALLEVNNLQRRNILRVGQELVIPVGR